MNIKLYQRVALTKDISEKNLQQGDIVTVVENLPPSKESNGEQGVALEVFNGLGETKAIIFVPISFVRPLSANEVLHIRKIA